MRWPKPELPLALVGESVEFMMPLNEFTAGTPAAVEEISDEDYTDMVWRIDISIATLLALTTEMSEILCKGIPTENGLDFDQFSIDDTNTTVLPMWVKKAMRDINNVLFGVNKELSISAEYNTDPYGLVPIGAPPQTVVAGKVYTTGVSSLYYAVADATVSDFDLEMVKLPDNFTPTGKIIHYIQTPVNQSGVIQDVRQSVLNYYMNSLLKDFYILKPAAQKIVPLFMANMDEAKSGIGLVKSKPHLKTTRLKSHWP